MKKADLEALATGKPPKKKNAAAVALGKLGGRARARALSPEERSKSASRASRKRWGDRLAQMWAEVRAREKAKEKERSKTERR